MALSNLDYTAQWWMKKCLQCFDAVGWEAERATGL